MAKVWKRHPLLLGTTLCEAISYISGKDDEGRINFLIHRYYEDIAYMAYARQYVTENYLPDMGFNYRHIDSQDGKVAELVKDTINEYMKENYPDIYKLVSKLIIKMPWIRMFETDLKLTLK